jgi:hypothetical protein
MRSYVSMGTVATDGDYLSGIFRQFGALEIIQNV